jgi:hypothetical protein
VAADTDDSTQRYFLGRRDSAKVEVNKRSVGDGGFACSK